MQLGYIQLVGVKSIRANISLLGAINMKFTYLHLILQYQECASSITDIGKGSKIGKPTSNCSLVCCIQFHTNGEKY